MWWVALYCSLLWFFTPALLCAQTYEVLHEGLFSVGNYWQFDSVASTGGFATYWRIVRAEQVGSYDTVVLQETTPYYVDDMNIYLNQTAMTIVEINETRYGPPVQHIVATYSDPLEKIPRTVNASDLARQFGHGQSSAYIVENPAQQWSRTQEQFVSFVGIERITVPAGTFDCVVLLVEETWVYNSGYWGTARRFFWMHTIFGPIAMNYEVWDYYPDGTLYSHSSVSHQLRLFVSAVPDLIVSQGSFSPQIADTGETVTVDWIEGCLYLDAATTHATDVYLTTDTLITANDVRLIEGREIPPLAAGQSVSVSESAPLPALLGAGQYYVAIAVDVSDEIAELNENNTFVLNGMLTAVAKPDLTVTAGSFTPHVIAPGDALSVSATIANVGGETAAATWAHIYLSVNETVDASDFALVTGIQVPALSPLAEHPINRNALVPSSFPEGTYYVLIQCDVGNAIEEVDEGNNTRALTPTLLVGRPDLTVTGGSFTPDAVMVGRTIAVQAEIANVGPRTAAANWIHVLLSTDNNITPDDTLLQSPQRCPELSSGGVCTINANPTIPAATPVGTYYVGVICDAADEIAEGNENNNAAALAGTLEVTPPPDLRANLLNFAPLVVNQGDPIALAGYIVNGGGTATNSSFWVEFYVSPNTDFSPPRHMLCDSAHVPPLDARKSFPLHSLARTVSGSVPDGEYTLGIKIDALNEVSESDETNNLAWVSRRRLYIGVQPTRARCWHLYR
ncbi:hypothetical protein AMJ85_07020 [candidate division BRC1 bacterium SM23_51]|nr:MAG: hypothetical protein AMJ85_07020 [candidate division BRC1 bacterium SM23_51]